MQTRACRENSVQSTLRKVRLPTSEGAYAARSVRLGPNFKIKLKIMAAAKNSETFSVYAHGANVHENVKMSCKTHLYGACQAKI